MTALASPPPSADSVRSVVLLESAAGAELHLRSQTGELMRIPLKGASRRNSLAALAMMAGVIGGAGGSRFRNKASRV